VWWAGSRRLGQAGEEELLITEGAPDATLASAVSTDARFEFLRTVFNQEENDRCVHRGGCPMGVALGHGGKMGPDAAILTRYLQQIGTSSTHPFSCLSSPATLPVSGRSDGRETWLW
jgi:hypothetical protein